jgi:glucosamine-6-phosphate deaminase
MKVDIVCCGIGENGHLAFNDPHVAYFDDPEVVKIVLIDEVCRNQQVHDGCFASLDLVPKSALTLTLPTLMNAEEIICIVPCSSKASAINAVVNGTITTECPATILRTHDNARLYCDKFSAEKILL